MWFIVFLEKFIDKYNDLYSISVHTWFDWDSFKMSICSSSCLSVDLTVCVGDAGAELQHISAGIFMTWLGSTVSGHDSRSFSNWIYFCPGQSSKRWLLFETWLPFRQSQWKVLSRLRLTLSSLRKPPSLSLPSPVSPSQWKVWSHQVNILLYNRQSQRRNSPLWLKRSQLSWTDVHKMKLHAGKMTLISIQAKKKKKLHIRTPRSHEHMHVPVSAPLCQETLEMNSSIKDQILAVISGWMGRLSEPETRRQEWFYTARSLRYNS